MSQIIETLYADAKKEASMLCTVAKLRRFQKIKGVKMKKKG